tara:strand:- start:2 stop:376 length:375 start_codon:yes stop_codon:yes gene_type:complete
MATASEPLEPDWLVARMNAIRNEGEVHVSELHDEADRLTDWREYVRANPLASFAIASAVGYSVVSSVSGRGSASKVSRKPSSEAVPADTVASMGITSGLMALAGSLASTAVRQYLTHKVKGWSP